MTATTNRAKLRDEDGAITYKSGVFHAIEGHHPETDKPGVFLQYPTESLNSPEEDSVRFVPSVELVSIVDEIALEDEPMNELISQAMSMEC